ncbi:MAG: putative site-specific recombinase [Pseudomonadota bacterium]|jgi:integrase/recombinase XerC
MGEAPGWPNWVEQHLDHLRHEKRLSPRTLAIHAFELQRLRTLLDERGLNLDQVDAHWARAAVARLHAQGLSPKSLALTLSCWRSLFSHGVQQGFLRHHPLVGIKAPKAAKPLPKALSVDDAVALAQHQDPDADPWSRARDHAAIELLYGCGLRVSELVGLDVQASPKAAGWIDVPGREVHVLGKGGKRRSVPLGQAALDAVEAWMSIRAQGLDAAHPTPALFLGRRGQRLTPHVLRQSLKRWALGAGLPTSVHPHMLRHSFASHVLQSSGDLRGVQELLGHASIQATQVYTRLDFQHLAQTYDSAHPRAKRNT